MIKKLLFDYNLTNPEGVHWNGGTYTPNGISNSTTYFIKSDYLGDWVILKCPYPTMLTKFNFIARSTTPNRAPAEWKCYGSNDGLTFTEITQASQLTRLTQSDYTN